MRSPFCDPLEATRAIDVPHVRDTFFRFLETFQVIERRRRSA
jgi:hypothetical protein